MNTPYLKRYRHGEYLQYMIDFSKLLKKQDIQALQLTTQKAALDPIIDTINAAFKQSRGSVLAQEIIALNERRDRAIGGLKSITEAYKYHFDTTMVDASEILNNIIMSHGDNIQRLSYQEETTVINSIIKEIETEAANALTTLNIGDWATELKDSNAMFSAKYLDLVGETALNPSTNIPNLRIQATQAYRTLINHIQAHATLNESEIYSTLLDQVDILAERYNQVINNRSNTSAKDGMTTIEIEQSTLF